MQANILFPINAEAFTYLLPEELEVKIKIGSRVLAPFKRGKKVGIVVGINENLEVQGSRQCLARIAPARIDTNKRATVKVAPTRRKEITLKSIEAVLDDEPLIPENLLKLIQWVGQYYMSTSGLALKNAVPSGILEGKKGGRGQDYL